MKRVSGLVLMLLCAVRLVAAPAAEERIVIHRTSSPVSIDGDLSDAAWQNATKFDTWYETNPGDNIEPKEKTVGWVMYDDKFLYFGIESSDSKPSDIIAPYADHDQISGNTDDYAGVIIDSRNDGKTAYLFLLTARGVQYDAVTDDAGNGEDNSPDYFWDSAAKVHGKGWTAEARIPFSSLRYDNPNPDQWGLILYRNWPRDRRYQMFSHKLPRDSNCFVCNYHKVTGLTGLPGGDHMVLAPYVSARQLSEPREGVLGNDFVNHQVGGEAGLDFKWNPTADMAVDATINPDFSQVESDVAVISTNERFAIFIPEKRPFFLEGIELFSTPIQAVYTRTLTSPRWGGRTTGKTGDYAYTFLVTQDRGGGSVILPSAFGSDLADQDFSSIAAIGRVRRDFGRSFASMLVTTREGEDGSHNRVIGPDFQWRGGDHHTLTGQFLYSTTENPDRPDLSSQWNGEKLSGTAAYAWYQYSTAKNDFYISGSDYDDQFRADNGFVPQVGWRGSYAEGGRTWRPTEGFFSRIRLFAMGEYQQTQDGNMLYRLASAGVGMDGRRRSFIRIRPAHDTVRSGNELLTRNRVYFEGQMGVSRVFSFINTNGWFGDEIDFTNDRLGRGANINVNATIRPTNHLALALTTSVRWLSIDGDRLFTSQVERVRATYTFNPRMFLRAIVQNTRTNRDVALYGFETAQHSGELSNQLLFAYKLNWQTVFYVGYGDLQEALSQDGDFEPANRQFFAKLSYAFQR